MARETVLLHLDLFMFLRSLRLFAATLLAVLLAVACGGDSAPPAPTGLNVTAGDTTATVTWTMVPGEEYWLFFGQTSTPPDISSMHNWIGLPGGQVLLKVTSPYLVTGLTNTYPYSFSVNGRINGGPGGEGAVAVLPSVSTITPRLAGSKWNTPATNSAGSATLKSVAYGSQTTTTTNSAGASVSTSVANYIAVGDGGAMYSSPDGVAWTPIAYSTTRNLNGASFFGTYKVVGDGGLVLVSSDGVTWGPQTTPTTNALYAIATNNVGLTVAVGANGTIIYNANGTDWFAATSSGTATNLDLYAVTNDTYTGLWVAVGAGGTIVTSLDGLNWTKVTSSSTAALHGVATSGVGVLFGASAFVAVGAPTALGASATVLSSVDGSTWVAQPLPVDPVTHLPLFTGTLNGVANGGQYVAVGTGGNIFFSPDGITWTAASYDPLTPSNTKDLFAIAHGLYEYSAVGATGTNLLSK